MGTNFFYPIFLPARDLRKGSRDRKREKKDGEKRKRAESEFVKMMVKKKNQIQLLFMLRDHVPLLPFLFTLLRQRENKMHLDYGTMTEKGNGERE